MNEAFEFASITLLGTSSNDQIVTHCLWTCSTIFVLDKDLARFIHVALTRCGINRLVPAGS